MSNDKYYTVKEAAELLNLTDRMIRKLCTEKQLEFYRFGKVIRIKESDLKNYIESQKNILKGE